MVVGVQDVEGRFSGIQVTFLTFDGRKAPIEPQRKTFGPVKGGAVRLTLDRVIPWPPRPLEEIILAEGVETALSVLIAMRIPTWATLGTSGLIAVRLPDSITTVTIAADADDAGETAAREGALRLTREGRKVRIVRPSRSGSDFNDILSAR
jgi:putative DNA primase/helicase